MLFLYLLGVERPSRRVIYSVLGLSLCACVAAAGEVNFHLLGFLLMTGASCSDAVRLVVAQKLLSNHRMQPVETLHVGRPL